MGEYAEMMLDGTCCSQCGEFLFDGEDGDGLAMLCEACAGDDEVSFAAPMILPDQHAEPQKRASRKRSKAKKP